MDENQSTTPTPSDHLEVPLKEPLPLPALNYVDIESVANAIVQSPNNHDRIHVEMGSFHSEKEK